MKLGIHQHVRPYLDMHDQMSIGNLAWIAINILALQQRKKAALVHTGPLATLIKECQGSSKGRQQAAAWVSRLFGSLLQYPSNPTCQSTFYDTVKDAQFEHPFTLAEVISFLRHQDQYRLFIPTCPFPFPKEHDLVVHIRGGDVLPGQYSGWLPFYVQPPLAFYNEAITRHKEQFPCCTVYLITESETHPYCSALKQFHTQVQFQIGQTSCEDFLTMTKAHHLVLARGSFSLMGGLIGCAAGLLRSIYVFQEIEESIERHNDWSFLKTVDFAQQKVMTHLAHSKERRYCQCRCREDEWEQMMSSTLELEWSLSL